jgi:hypothetical protein
MSTYPIGTRYSNSEIYDEATDEHVHGWQVFIQKRPDGTPTGRRSFVDQDGKLCGIELAAAKRAGAIRDAAPDLLAACQAAEPLLADMERILNKRLPGSSTSLQALTTVREAITKAIGSRG